MHLNEPKQKIVGNKTKGRISKRVFQESKARHVLCFLGTPVLRFALLPYYRRNDAERKFNFDYVCPEEYLIVNKENFEQENSKKSNISLVENLKNNDGKKNLFWTLGLFFNWLLSASKLNFVI